MRFHLFASAMKSRFYPSRKWYPGTVESYQDGKATVTFRWGNVDRTGEFELREMRFPNNEGHWLVWKDATGKSSVEARYISRTETDVTIRKADGSELTVPIESLHPTLRKQVAKTPVSSDLTFPVHVGDQVEVNYFAKWYDGTVRSVIGDTVSVEYESGDASTSTKDFELKDIRFPNGEGHWMIWKDASGKFKVEARYLSRTDTDVTIRKTDGTEATVPIDALHPTLRQLVAKTTVTSELNKIDGAIPIRVGDPVQVKSWSSWYDGVVKEVKIGGAEVEYTRGSWGKKNEYFDLKDIRYPNGEGPWREWSDASGGFKIIARYLARNETHVTILKEDQTELDVPIDRLNSPIKRLLKQTPIIARRPPLVTLADAELLGDDEDLSPSQRMLTSRSRSRNAAAAAPDLATVSIQIGTPVSQQTLRLPQAGLAFPIEPKSTIGEVIPIGGSDGWVAISTEGDRWSPETC